MQKIYSTACSGSSSAIFKTALATFFSFFILNLSELKAQAGNNLSYDGIDDYVTLGNGVVKSLSGDYTIEAWVYWRGARTSAPTTSTVFQRVFDFGVTGDPTINPWIWFALDAGSNNPRFAISTNGLGSPQSLDASIPFPQNTWTHLAIVYVQSTNTATIYIDGTNRGSGTITISPSSLGGVGGTDQNFLGRSQFPSDPYFNGQIEEFRISNVARYTTNFAPVPKTEFTTNVGDLTTVALYHFNEGVGTTTADAKGNFNATLAASPSTPTWVGGSILPIKLASVSAIVNNNAVDVKWSASLDRESEFVIERSNNGANFSAIGTVSKTSGTNGFENFSFHDNAPLNGRSYYRLKCTETGSASFYSKTIPVAISAREDLLIYPNPVNKNFITVELPKAYTGNIEFTISSASGVAVFKQKMNVVDRKEFQLPKNSSFLPGIYILEINSGGIERSKVIIYQ
jgi:hypothetical protein